MKQTDKRAAPREGAGLRFLYRTLPGRVLLRLLTARWVSKFAGFLLDSPPSRLLIRGFFRKNGINRDDFLP